MINKGELLSLFLILGVVTVLVSDANLTGKAIYQEPLSNFQLCVDAGLKSGCLYQEKIDLQGNVQKQELSKPGWNQELRNFGVICDYYNFNEGKITLDKDDNLLTVEVLIGPGGDTCSLDGRIKKLDAGTRLVYTPTSITAFLQPIKSGFFQRIFGGKLSIPELVSSEIFPSFSQTSTRNTVKVCFKGTDKYSNVNVEFKKSDVVIKTIPLFDDGNHFDNDAKDGCYGTALDGLLPEGKYSVSYLINN